MKTSQLAVSRPAESHTMVSLFLSLPRIPRQCRLSCHLDGPGRKQIDSPSDEDDKFSSPTCCVKKQTSRTSGRRLAPAQDLLDGLKTPTTAIQTRSLIKMLSLILATIIAAGSVQAMSMSMPVFAGCVEQKNTNSGSYQLIKNQMSAMQCASSCFAMDTKYIWSYYAGAGNVCGCAETGITPEMYGTALDSSGDCPQTSYAVSRS
ncbi:hypothetical protein BD324DRAFT_457953 [Kockovaella imperatae]|uniref:WSC domain-containing protein n=1 Tax=Kockovaella imperatae TaxID=4999 RepID=A0A1Y1UGH6_9TREE|nr:hypothetical protein BD324DRAFT_457953 [Kockovaella imperatae]ORX36616.1 hypothetical protein BD324DRAFT_457953 [Kockovaella imperatae]